MSTAITAGIRVETNPYYVPERSQPDALYFFAYQITISNVGDQPAQLVSRHWIITDGDGRIEQVRGPGVVGNQPRLEPGQSFEYTSFCPLPTPVGEMQGTYQMVRDDGEKFDAEVAAFTLATPESMN